MVKNKIVLTAEAELEDMGAREWLSILSKKLDNVNQRTKKHTIEIKNLEKELKERKVSK